MKNKEKTLANYKPYYVKFKFLTPDTAGVYVGAENPEVAAEAAKQLIPDEYLNAEIISVEEYKQEKQVLN